MTTYVIVAGLPGTGKSTLAVALAEALDGVVLDKDKVRASLFPGKFTDFSREQDDLCYEAILTAAAYLAAHQAARFIFLDGRTFSRKEHLERVVGAALMAGCKWKILLTTCPDALAEQRLVAGESSHLAGNRTPQMYHALRASFEAIDYPHQVIDTSLQLSVGVERAARYLRNLPVDALAP